MTTMNGQHPIKLIRANAAYQRWRGNPEDRIPNADAVKAWLEESKLKIHATFPTARGETRLLDETEVAAWIAARRPVAVVDDDKLPSTHKGELHLAALETKIDRLTARVGGLEQAINTLITSQNLWVEDLRKLIAALK